MQAGLSQFPQCLLNFETGNVCNATYYLLQHRAVYSAVEHHFSAVINHQPILSQAQWQESERKPEAETDFTLRQNERISARPPN